MSKIILSISLSLDGFIAGPEISQENPMGLNGKLLHSWIFEKKQKGDEMIASDLFNKCGVVIIGSNTYRTAIDGVWESQSPFPFPALVLSSKKHTVIDGFTLIDGGIQNALQNARSIAKEKDIWIMGGANAAQQFMENDLLNEIHLHIVPILLGSGTKLFRKESNRMIEFVKIKVVETVGATHLFLKPFLRKFLHADTE